MRQQVFPNYTDLATQANKNQKTRSAMGRMGRHYSVLESNKNVLFGLLDLKEAIQLAASKSYLKTLFNSLKIFIPVTIWFLEIFCLLSKKIVFFFK